MLQGELVVATLKTFILAVFSGFPGQYLLSLFVICIKAPILGAIIIYGNEAKWNVLSSLQIGYWNEGGVSVLNNPECTPFMAACFIFSIS